MTDRSNDDAAGHALESSSREYAEIDNLIIKLATGGLGFSIALGAFQAEQQTGWIMASWFSLLGCILVVMASKYISAEANRAFYLSRRHSNPDDRQKNAALERRLDMWVTRTNYAGAALFLLGAAFVVCHVIAVGR